MAKSRTFAVYEKTGGPSGGIPEARNLRFIACVRATARNVFSVARKAAGSRKNLTIVEDRDCGNRRR